MAYINDGMRCAKCGHLEKLHPKPEHLQEFNDNQMYCSVRNCTCTERRYNMKYAKGE